MEDTIHISTEKSLLDVHVIHDYLSNRSYWAKGRSIETVKKSIENSFCFGVYTGNQQIGFARVVTDFAVYAYILDVFILESHRGKGLGKKLMQEIMNHEQLQNLQRWGLATNDAHGLYEKYGFKTLAHSEKHMEVVNKPR